MQYQKISYIGQTKYKRVLFSCSVRLRMYMVDHLTFRVWIRFKKKKFRLIIRFSKTVRKRSIVTLAEWQLTSSCWNQMSFISSFSLFGNKNSLSMARWRSPLTVTAAPCSFSKKNVAIIPPYQNSHQIDIRCRCTGFSIMTFGFSEPQMRQFCLLTLLNFCPNNRKCTEIWIDGMGHSKASHGSHLNDVVFYF